MSDIIMDRGHFGSIAEFQDPEQLYKELGLSDDKRTTDDMLFTVETVSCLGACGLAPVMTVNDDVYGRLVADDVPSILAKYKDA